MHDDSRRYHRCRGYQRKVRRYNQSTSSPEILRPFGQLPNQIAGRAYGSEIAPLLRYLGFGAQAGTPKAEANAKRLAGATGPLADLIRQFIPFESGVLPGTEQIGTEISSRGSAAFTGLQTQIDQALAQLPGYQAQAKAASDLASTYAQQAFSPVANEDLYRTAATRLDTSLGENAAASGLAGTGAADQARADATRQLVMGFRGAQDQQQQNAIAQLGQTAAGGANLLAAGPQLAGGLLEAVPQLAQLLSAQYGLPMESVSSLLQLLMSGGQGAQGLLGATAPVVSSSSSGFGIL